MYVRDLNDDDNDADNYDDKEKNLKPYDDDILTCLHMMGEIPRHENEFEEFCRELLRNSDTDEDLARMIKDIGA